MDYKKKRKLAYIMAAVLFFVSIICLAGFHCETEANPLRILFSNTAGNILFSHSTHFSKKGYAVECIECHHDWDEGKTPPVSCSECHIDEDEDIPNRTDALHTQCIGCHEDVESGPVRCDGCHMMKK